MLYEVITLFLSILLALARLNQDNELVMMAVAGVGKKHLLYIVGKYCLFFSIIIGVISFIVITSYSIHYTKLYEVAGSVCPVWPGSLPAFAFPCQQHRRNNFV